MPDTTTTTLPVLPLTAGVVGPGMVVTVVLESPEAATAADAAEAAGRRLLLVPQVDGRTARVGVIAALEDAGAGRGGRRAVLLRGLERAVVGAGVPGSGPGLWVAAEPVAEPDLPSEEVRRLAAEYRAVVESILERRGAGRLAEALRGIAEPGAIADTALYSPDLSLDQKVAVLEAVDVEERLRLVLGWAKDTLAEVSIRQDIDRDVGEGDEDVVAEYRRRLDESGAPDGVRAAVEKELDKLERTSGQSPEHGWIVSWLDAVLEVPWSTRADEVHDLGAVRAVLDADHSGLEDVKERIVEALAVRTLRAERGVEAAGGRGSGHILALVGPPGVGKTSLGESVSRALGRPFARVSLGGVRDEAEIRGHRRTYVGARPGRFVRALTEAGAMNPVLLLDEIDKVGSDWRGDPSSALLEVLDPAQNHTFRDHYLEVDLDLSDVLFLATANVLDTIPGPLLDRVEVVRLDGYTEDEKVAIARDHLL